MSGYRLQLVHDLSGLLKVYKAGPSSSIPILMPPNSGRLRRWQSVLSSYECVRPPAQLTARESGHWIVVIGKDLIATGEYLSTFLGRSFRQLESIGDLSRWITQNSPTSVLAIARAAAWSTDAVRSVANCVQETERTAWGILPTQDLPGLTFAAAKLLLSRMSKRPADVYIDAYRDTIEILTADKEGTEKAVDPLKQEWRALILRAHGEGSHVNLNKTVLCGAPVEGERDLEGRNVRGCEAGRRCKRVCGSSTEIVAVSDVRTNLLCLLSCNGFSVCGEHYPSNSSVAISALDGYAASVLTTTMQTAPADCLPRVLHGLMLQRYTLGAICRIMNDCEIAASGNPLYVLCGDPNTQITDPDDVESDRKIERVERKTVHHLDLGTLRSGSTVEVSQSVDAVRGTKEILVLGQRDAIANARIVDRTSDINEFDRRIRRLMLRVYSAQHLERTIQSILMPQIQENEGFAVALDQLTAARHQTERCLWQGLRACQVAQRDGIWLPGIETWTRSATLGVTTWDGGLAAIIRNHLFDKLFNVLHFYHRHSKSYASDNCPRCGASVLVTDYDSPDGVVMRRQSRECVVCGPLTEVPECGVQVDIELTTPLRAGRRATLKLSSDPIGTGGVCVDKGVAAIEIQDRAREVNIISALRTGLGHRDEVEFVVPNDMSCDLHLARVAWVQEFQVSFARCRSPLLL